MLNTGNKIGAAAAGFLLVFQTALLAADEKPWYQNAGSIRAYSLMSQVRVREKPGLDTKVLGSLEEGEFVQFLGEAGEKTFQVDLRGKRYNVPFLKIQKQDGTTGWVYAAALSKDDPYAILSAESLGGLKLGMTASQILGILGQPDSKGKNEVQGADGLAHQEWAYKTRGIVFDMATDKGGQKVSSIQVIAPGKYQTRKKVGIGSSFDAVRGAYLGFLDDPSVKSGDSLTVGSVYGGLVFHFKNGKVDSIFMGASAE